MNVMIPEFRFRLDTPKNCKTAGQLSVYDEILTAPPFAFAPWRVRIVKLVATEGLRFLPRIAVPTTLGESRQASRGLEA